MPAQAGIDLRLGCEAGTNLESGRRRNVESESRLPINAFRAPRVRGEGYSVLSIDPARFPTARFV
jgi:hypothetical protein